jgi:hypothetical protein
VVGWNLAAKTEEDEEAAKTRWMELVNERARVDSVCVEDEVEQEATMCQETLSKVLDVTEKKIRFCAKSKRWWNGDIQARRKTLGQEQRRRGHHSQGAARAKAELQKSIPKSKSPMWSCYLQNL